MKNSKFFLAFIIILFLGKNTCISQSDTITNSQIPNAPKLFILCPYCDLDYIRREISFMNFVRHPDEADLKILITSKGTASGGGEYSIMFEGNDSLKNRKDTLNYISKINDSEDLVRKGLVKKIKLGLIPYIANNKLSDNITIDFKKKEGEETKPVDNWDFWIFSLGAYGYFSGEKSSNSTSLWGSLSARRITEEFKFELSYDYSYYEDNFSYDNLSVQSISRSNNIDLELVKSIDEHLSAGFFSNANRSSYFNTDLSTKLLAGVEYNFYPYSQSSNREFSFKYLIGYQYYKYYEETIYNKEHENLGLHKASITYLIKDTWGSINTTLSYSNYLNDFSKKNLNIYSDLSIYLFGGLSLSMWGSFSMVHDQIYLPKGTADPEEVLLRRKAISTNYRYYTSIGLTYSFGSIYNNVVNPRF